MATQPDGTTRPPNVVLVLTDDQGYGDLGCHGNPILRTPHLDAFHAAAVRLTDFHVGPTCAPTRAGLLTGRYANSTGVWHTIGGRSLLRRGERTMAELFAAAGYRTGIFGKWHLGDAHPYRPQDRGFHEAVVHGGGGVGNTPDYWGNDYFDDTYCANGQWQPFAGYCTDVWFGLGLDFIARHRDQPFFCYIATNAPHLPHIVEPRYAAPYLPPVCPHESRARYYGMVSNIDHNFGALRSRLAEWALEDDTIVVFMTDNGSAGGVEVDDDQYVTSGYNAGMRGKKGSPYEGGHRVPLFLRWPAGGIGGGREVTELTANVDLLPTLMELCRLGDGAAQDLDGSSLAPLLGAQPAAGREDAGGTDRWAQRIVVTDSQRLARPVKWRRSAAMAGSWRLIDGSELYDLAADPEQRADVAADHPHVVERLRAGYERWWQRVTELADGEIPLVIGAGDAPQTLINAHDWRNVEDPLCVWNQCQVRQGLQYNGYWEIEVMRAGHYQFELRRWPREAELPVAAGIEGAEQVGYGAMSYDVRYGGGRALPIVVAQFQVGDQRLAAPLAADDQAATFGIELQPGPTHLLTKFLGAEDGNGDGNAEQLELGAYYVYVTFQGSNEPPAHRAPAHRAPAQRRMTDG